MDTYSDFAEFGKDYFKGCECDDPPDGGYNDYLPGSARYQDFAETIADTTDGEKILVVGCATGQTVKCLLREDIDHPYGMDVSQWAVDNALPRYQERIFQGDVRNGDRIEELSEQTDGPDEWDVIYTEFVLSHYGDDVAQDIYDVCRNHATQVIHHTWQSETDSDLENFNLHSISEWQETLGQHDDVDWLDYDRPEDSTI